MTTKLRIVVALAFAACSGPPPSGDDGGSASDAGTFGTVGGPCLSDGDCPAGNACLPPAIGAGTGKYCAPSCTTIDDCRAFEASSFKITVPSTVTPQGGSPTSTVFGSVLARGVACAPVEGRGQYCQFACSNTQAMSTDHQCYCLPGYHQNAAGTDCVFDASQQCSILTFAPADQRQALLDHFGIQVAVTQCDACNSDESFTSGLGCHTGLFGCEIYNVDLKGHCAELVTQEAFHACLAQKENFSCSCSSSCVDSCGADAFITDCGNACCTCTQSPSAPAPECTSGSDGGSAAHDGGVSKAGVGIGDPCMSDAECPAGGDCYLAGSSGVGWCESPCTLDSDCPGAHAGSTNAEGFQNYCVFYTLPDGGTDSQGWCTPGCASNSDCRYFDQSYCYAGTTPSFCSY
jgi:hypothetical protein